MKINDIPVVYSESQDKEEISTLQKVISTLKKHNIDHTVSNS